MTSETVQATLTGIELVAFIASIASLILAIGAIWLSIVFFRMSNEASKATTEAAKGIDASVQRLEKLFDKLYSDTFSMMKETVSDMRKHIWNVDDESVSSEEERNKILEEADKKADEKVSEIKSALDKQLNEILARQKIADGKVSGIGKELESLLENAIQTSRMVESEAREETIRNHILSEIRKFRRKGKIAIAEELVDQLGDFLPPHKVVKEVQRMKDEGILYFEGDHLAAASKIRLARISERTADIES